MMPIILGKPIIFWFGLLALTSLIAQMYLGYKLTHGRPGWFKYHRWNAIILASLVGIHVLLGLSLYLFPPQTRPLSATTAQAPVETTAVSMRNYAFEPKAIAVTRGDTVVWTNEDPILHDVSIGDSVSPALSKGQTYSYAFTTAGTFDYFCPLHPFMRGTVVVR